MISRSHRFRGYNSLRFVYRNGQTARGPLFAVKAVHNPRRNSYRLAVVVSRKVNKSAVKRNRIRRRLYEATRIIEKDILGSWDIVITVFQDNILDETSEKVTAQLKTQLDQVGALGKRLTSVKS